MGAVIWYMALFMKRFPRSSADRIALSGSMSAREAAFDRRPIFMINDEASFMITCIIRDDRGDIDA